MIVISGVAGGVGSALALQLLKTDVVVGIYHRTTPSVPQNERLELERVDLSDKTAIGEFVRRRRKSLRRITVIHCATVSVDGLVAQYAEDTWDRVMDVNVKGVFLLTQALLPLMMVERWGRIIHISSVVAARGEAGAAAYGASKAALTGFSRGLAKEYGRFNITSNVLQLGFFEAGLGTKLSPEHRSRILDQIPSGRFGPTSDIEAGVEFLIRCDYVSGSVISIDGAI